MINLKELLQENEMILEYQNKVGSTIVVIKGKTKGDAEALFRDITADMLKRLGDLKKLTLEF